MSILLTVTQRELEPPDMDATRRTVQEFWSRNDQDGLVKLLYAEREERYLLTLKLQEMRADKYGRSSEKLRGEQFELLQLAEQRSVCAEQPLPEPPAAPPTPAKTPRKRGGRKPFPKELERQRIVVEPDPYQLAEAFGTGKVTSIREDIREVLHYVPAKLVVLEYVYPNYTSDEGEGGVVTAERAVVPVEGSIPSSALLAHTLVAKYLWHMPLHRLARQFAMMGCPISVATLCNWVKYGDSLLQTLYVLFKDATLEDYLLATDDTAVNVLDKSAKNGLRKGHMWLHMGETAHFFEFRPDWKGEPVRETLAPHKGPIQADGYKGLKALFKDPKVPRVEVGCWMHGRRGFKKALDIKDARAAHPMAIIKRLYAVEACADLWGHKGDARRDFRQVHSAPLCSALHQWLETEGKRISPRCPLGKAVTYAINQWDSLQVFLTDGRIPIDNGRVERLLRGLAMGRNNWFFFGADAGGERAAVILTAISNCIQHGVDPEKWLTDVFEKLATGWKGRCVDLLPAAWAKNQAQKAAAEVAAKAA